MAPKAKAKRESNREAIRSLGSKPAPVEEEATVEEVVEEAPAPKAKAKAAPKAKAAAPAAPKAAPKAKKQVVVVEEQVVEEEVEVEADDGKRHFRILTDSISIQVPQENLPKNGGRFSGVMPMQAAKKAFTQIAKAYQKASGNEESEFSFSISETTRGSARKTFSYTGSRVRLETPQVIKKQGTEFEIRFHNEVKAVKQQQEEAAAPEPAQPQQRAKAARRAAAEVEVAAPAAKGKAKGKGKAKRKEF